MPPLTPQILEEDEQSITFDTPAGPIRVPRQQAQRLNLPTGVPGTGVEEALAGPTVDLPPIDVPPTAEAGITPLSASLPPSGVEGVLADAPPDIPLPGQEPVDAPFATDAAGPPVSRPPVVPALSTAPGAPARQLTPDQRRESLFGQAQAKQVVGEVGKGTVQARAAEEEALIRKATFAAEAEKRRQAVLGGHRDLAAVQNAKKKHAEDQAAHEKRGINPSRHFQRLPTGKKLLAIIGLVLGGIGQVKTGRRNLALDIFNKAVEEDVDLQVREIEKAGNRLTAEGKALTAKQAAAVAQASLLTAKEIAENTPEQQRQLITIRDAGLAEQFIASRQAVATSAEKKADLEILKGAASAKGLTATQKYLKLSAEREKAELEAQGLREDLGEGDEPGVTTFEGKTIFSNQLPSVFDENGKEIEVKGHVTILENGRRKAGVRIEDDAARNELRAQITNTVIQGRAVKTIRNRLGAARNAINDGNKALAFQMVNVPLARYIQSGPRITDKDLEIISSAIGTEDPQRVLTMLSEEEKFATLEAGLTTQEGIARELIGQVARGHDIDFNYTEFPLELPTRKKQKTTFEIERAIKRASGDVVDFRGAPPASAYAKPADRARAIKFAGLTDPEDERIAVTEFSEAFEAEIGATVRNERLAFLFAAARARIDAEPNPKLKDRMRSSSIHLFHRLQKKIDGPRPGDPNPARGKREPSLPFVN